VARELVEERQVAGVCAALVPYEWRSFAPPMLARCGLGALDRHRVLDLVAGGPGRRSVIRGRWSRRNVETFAWRCWSTSCPATGGER
jgi:hypothetical protein